MTGAKSEGIDRSQRQRPAMVSWGGDGSLMASHEDRKDGVHSLEGLRLQGPSVVFGPLPSQKGPSDSCRKVVY